MQTIHFKVAAQNSIRRFAIADPTYCSIRGQVASLFGLGVNAKWSLQYRDEEKHMIAFSSDEELKLACQLARNQVVHLEVILQDCEVKVPKENKERGRKPRSIKCLSKKQLRVRDRIAALANEDSGRAKSQKAKLEQKLAEVTAELDQLTRVLVTESANSSALISVAPSEAPPVLFSTKQNNELVAPKPVVSQTMNLDKQLVTEVSSRFFGMRRELQQDRMRVHSLRKVLKAMQVLSCHSSRSGSNVQVSVEQIDQTKASLVAATDEFSAKKELLKTLSKEKKHCSRKEGGFERKDSRCRDNKPWKDRKGDRKERKEKGEKKEKKERRRRHCDFSSSEEISEKLEI